MIIENYTYTVLAIIEEPQNYERIIIPKENTQVFLHNGSNSILIKNFYWETVISYEFLNEAFREQNNINSNLDLFNLLNSWVNSRV